MRDILTYNYRITTKIIYQINKKADKAIFYTR